MALESNGYVFKPHEQPFMPGSPASPLHPTRRKVGYFIIGVFLAINAGLQNGLTLASISLLQGDLGLSKTEGAWLQVSYYMVYSCMSIFHFKIRQNFGMTPMIRSVLLLTLFSAAIDIFFNNYTSAIVSRGVAGLTSNGLMLMSLFYLMQGLPKAKAALGFLTAMGLFQFGLPLARIMVPYIFADGSMTAVYVLQFALALISLALVWWLPLPPTITEKTLSWVDIPSLGCLILGVAFACAFWAVGPTVWWDTYWLGYLAFFSLFFTGITLLIEYNRKDPMLLLDWISTRNILLFAFAGAMVRILTAEQNVGAMGLLRTLGMDVFQLVPYNAVILISSIVGFFSGVAMINMNDIRRPLIIAFFLIAVASFMDVGQSVDTRPQQLYVTQAIISFAALFFMGPLLMEGFVRALAKGVHAIISFSALFGLSQIIGALAGNALFLGFVKIRAQRHLTDSFASTSATDPNVAQYISTLSQSKALQTSDPIIQKATGASDYASMLQQQAQVSAYNDVFMLLGIIASITFVLFFGGWLYRQYKKINIIGEEMAKLGGGK